MSDSALQRILARTVSVHKPIAADLASLGGLLRCIECGAERPLGDIAAKLATGWPKCCNLTMRWITQRQLDDS